MGQLLRIVEMITIDTQGGLQCADDQLVAAQRAFEWMLADGLNQVLATEDDARLRAAEQLVAGDTDHGRAGAQAFLRQLLVRQPIALEGQQRATAEINEEWQIPRRGQRTQFLFRRRRGEADNSVVRCMDTGQHRGVLADGFLVVVQVGSVSGADLDQLAAGHGHDVGYAKRTADFDQLAARDRHFASCAQCGQHQQHGRGIIVDDGRCLGSGQLAQ